MINEIYLSPSRDENHGGAHPANYTTTKRNSFASVPGEFPNIRGSPGATPARELDAAIRVVSSFQKASDSTRRVNARK